MQADAGSWWLAGYMALIILAVVLLLLWILLPVAVFRMRSTLAAILDEQKQANALLRRMAEGLVSQNRPQERSIDSTPLFGQGALGRIDDAQRGGPAAK